MESTVRMSDAFRTRIKCVPLEARSWATAAPAPDVPPWGLELQAPTFIRGGRKSEHTIIIATFPSIARSFLFRYLLKHIFK